MCARRRTYFLLLRQKKVGKEKATRSGGLRCREDSPAWHGLEGRRARTRSACGCARTCARSQIVEARFARRPSSPRPSGASKRGPRANRTRWRFAPGKEGASPLSPTTDSHKRLVGGMLWRSGLPLLVRLAAGPGARSPLSHFSLREAPLLNGPRLEAPEV